MGKNIQRLKNIVDGNYERKIQVGPGDQEVEPDRKEGDRWFDSDGKEWEQKRGFRQSVSHLPSKGIADNCSDCNTFIIKPWDKDIYRKNGRCYYCQIDFEAKLKSYPIKYHAWRRLKDLKNMEDIEQDLIQWIDEQEKLRKINLLDKSVVNAIANENVAMSIKKNS